LRNPVAVDQPGSGDAGLRMPFQIGDERLDRSRVQTRVCIEHEHVLRSTRGHAPVCTGSVTDVGPGADKDRRGVPSYHRFRGVGSRRVVHDDDVVQDRRCKFADRMKGIVDQIGRLIVDDHNVRTGRG